MEVLPLLLDPLDAGDILDALAQIIHLLVELVDLCFDGQFFYLVG